MAGDKPTAAMVLSLIGGIFVIIGGATVAFIGSLFSSFAVPGTEGVSSTVLVLGLVGVIFGIIMILGGVMMYSKPASHTMWGAVVLVLSILSWVTAAGGIVIGFLLGLIGGILALVFKPSMGSMGMSGQSMGAMPASTMGSMGMGTTCKSCGASIPAGATRCPSCGASL